MEKNTRVNSNKKKARVAILSSNKAESRIRKVIRSRGESETIIVQEDITILNSMYLTIEHQNAWCKN